VYQSRCHGRTSRKSERRADLPVQALMKCGTVINLKTAWALGFILPHLLFSRADELIE
jgi:hypothetical protein